MSDQDPEVLEAISLLKNGVEIRKEITGVYLKYYRVVDIFRSHSEIKPSRSTCKKAVDAVYYLGGGWPLPNSPGRLEAFVGSFAALVLLLEFIGRKELVDKLLDEFGMKLSIDKRHKYKDRVFSQAEVEQIKVQLRKADPDLALEYESGPAKKTLRGLGNFMLDTCLGYQGEICEKADVIRDSIRPSVNNALGIENVDFARLTDTAKVEGKKRAARGKKITSVVDGFNKGLKVLIT